MNGHSQGADGSQRLELAHEQVAVGLPLIEVFAGHLNAVFKVKNLLVLGFPHK